MYLFCCKIGRYKQKRYKLVRRLVGKKKSIKQDEGETRGRREEDERKNKGNKTNVLITKELSEGLYLFFR